MQGDFQPDSIKFKHRNLLILIDVKGAFSLMPSFGVKILYTEIMISNEMPHWWLYVIVNYSKIEPQCLLALILLLTPPCAGTYANYGSICAKPKKSMLKIDMQPKEQT